MSQTATPDITGEPTVLGRSVTSTVRHDLPSLLKGIVYFKPRSINCAHSKPGKHICIAALNQTIVLTVCSLKEIKEDASRPSQVFGETQTIHLVPASNTDLTKSLEQITNCLGQHLGSYTITNHSACYQAKLPPPQEVLYWQEGETSLSLSLASLYQKLLGLEYLDNSLITGKAEFTIPQFVKHLSRRLVQAYHQVDNWFIKPLIALEQVGLVKILDDGSLLVRRVKLAKCKDIDLDLPPPPHPDDELVDGLMSRHSRPEREATMGRKRAPRAAHSSPPRRWPPNSFTGLVQVKPEASEAYQELRKMANRPSGDFTIIGPDRNLERWAKEHGLSATRLKRGLQQLRDQGVVRVINPHRPAFTVVVYEVQLTVAEPAPRPRRTKLDYAQAGRRALSTQVDRGQPNATSPDFPAPQPGQTAKEALVWQLVLEVIKTENSEVICARNPVLNLRSKVMTLGKGKGLSPIAIDNALRTPRQLGIIAPLDPSRKRPHDFIVHNVTFQEGLAERPRRIREPREPRPNPRKIAAETVDKGAVNAFLPQFTEPLSPLTPACTLVWQVILDLVRTENDDKVCARNPVLNLHRKAAKLCLNRAISVSTVNRTINALRQQGVIMPLNPEKKRPWDFIVHNARFQEPAMPLLPPPAANTNGNQLLWLMVASPVSLDEIARKLAKGKKPVLVLGGTALDPVGLDLAALLAPKGSSQE